MKKLLVSILLTFFATLLIFGPAFAGTYTFTPTPGDLYDLDHHYYYTWGINWNYTSLSETITAVTLKIKNIYDWTYEDDMLFMNLLPGNGTAGVTTGLDQALNTTDGPISNAYAGQGILLTTYTDPYGDYAHRINFSYSFTSSQINTLVSYLTDSSPNNFALGFDPDCHYFNDGVSLEITTSNGGSTGGGNPVPEPATVGLLGLGLLGMVGSAMRKKKLGTVQI